jgi:hypothetical protein
MAGDAGHTKIARRDETKTSAEENVTSDAAAHATDQSVAPNDTDDTTADAPKTSSHKAKTAAAGGAATSKSTVTKRRPLSEAQREELQADNRYDASQAYPRRRVQHTVRARFAGTTPDGSIVRLLPLALTTVVEEAAQVHRFQIVQTGADRLMLRLGTSSKGDRQAAWHAASSALHQYLKQQSLPNVRVALDKRSPIVDRRSGKLKEVLVDYAGESLTPTH